MRHATNFPPQTLGACDTRKTFPHRPWEHATREKVSPTVLGSMRHATNFPPRSLVACDTRENSPQRKFALVLLSGNESRLWVGPLVALIFAFGNESRFAFWCRRLVFSGSLPHGSLTQQNILPSAGPWVCKSLFLLCLLPGRSCSHFRFRK